MDARMSKELNKVEDVCIRDELPGCAAECPAHVDAKGIAQLIKSGDFAGAYKLFSSTVPFTRIISETCGRSCESECVRSRLGGEIQINKLEKACVDFGYKKNTLNKAFLPKKNEIIAVIGGGMSGLTAAYYLKRKGFGVDIYEKSGKLGGKLKDYIPQDIIESDISILFELGVNVIFNTEIKDIAEIENKYNAVYAAPGISAFDFKAADINPETFFVRNNIFSGGSIRTEAYSSIMSLSDGKRAATSIERHLQNVSVTVGREKEGSYKTPLHVNMDGYENETPVKASGGRFTKEEAMSEGTRCVNCRCDLCVAGCAFLKHYKTNPRQFIREVRNCLQISVGNRFANEAINSCSECGFCASVCPVGLDTGSVCSDAKKRMVKTNKMPPSAHDFALKDMAHSNGEDFFLAKHQQGYEESAYVFFPGCQLGAASPEIVKKVYADLCGRLEGGVGLNLGCCGAIAKWSAREDLFNEALRKLKSAWQDMGSPVVITACPTCYTIFKSNIPEVRVKGIWSVIEETGLPEISREPLELAVHDACTTRGDKEIHLSVRKLLADMGMDVKELGYSRELTQCCGFGGLTGFVNRELSDKAAEEVTAQSPYDYVVYCINCRDRFMAAGKKAYHFLELVYGGYDGGIREFGWSERRLNRERLKRGLLKDLWGETMKETVSIGIELDGSVAGLIEKRMILLSDIKSVIENAEKTSRKLRDLATGAFIAAERKGSVTFWVWYTKTESGYYVHKAYSHRMEIEGM